MIKHISTVAAYVAVTFLVQGSSHFAVFKAHYATIPYMRPEPVFLLGFGSMLIQGTVMSRLHERLASGASTLLKGIGHAWLIGAILVSYIAFAEAGKYAVPALGAWIGVELASAFVQFTLFGALMGLIHRYFDAKTP